MKRSRRNSVILKRAYYKMAPTYGLSAETFKKYLSDCIERGFIIDEGDRYVVAKFNTIIRTISETSGSYFGKHKILRGKSTNVKEITKELHEYFVIDNIILQQSLQIEKKKRDIELIKFATRTVKSDFFLKKADLKRLKQLRKEGKISAEYANKLQDSLINVAITSSRHTAKKLGVGSKKANSILNNSKLFEREIMVKWYKGISFWKIEELQMKFPKALVIPMINYNSIKVCFGSGISLSQEPLKSL